MAGRSGFGDSEPDRLRPSLFFNSVNGASGEYLFSPLSPRDLAEIAEAGLGDPARPELAQKWARA